YLVPRRIERNSGLVLPSVAKPRDDGEGLLTEGTDSLRDRFRVSRGVFERAIDGVEHRQERRRDQLPLVLALACDLARVSLAQVVQVGGGGPPAVLGGAGGPRRRDASGRRRRRWRAGWALPPRRPPRWAPPPAEVHPPGAAAPRRLPGR